VCTAQAGACGHHSRMPAGGWLGLCVWWAGPSTFLVAILAERRPICGAMLVLKGLLGRRMGCTNNRCMLLRANWVSMIVSCWRQLSIDPLKAS
jgi:hypothetical protein